MSELFKGARRIVTAHARYFSPDLALTGRTRRGVPDHPGTRAHDDKRNGTARLMAARDGATGKLTGRMVARHHSEKLLDLVSGGQARNAGTVVGDSVGPHKSTEVTGWLKNNANRTFPFTAAMWMTIVEGVFSRLSRQKPSHAPDTCIAATEGYIEHHNANDDRPFRGGKKSADLVTACKKGYWTLPELAS